MRHNVNCWICISEPKKSCLNKCRIESYKISRLNVTNCLTWICENNAIICMESILFLLCFTAGPNLYFLWWWQNYHELHRGSSVNPGLCLHLQQEGEHWGRCHTVVLEPRFVQELLWGAVLEFERLGCNKGQWIWKDIISESCPSMRAGIGKPENLEKKTRICCSTSL